MIGVVLVGLLSGCGSWSSLSAGRMPDPATAAPAPTDGIGYTPYTEDTIVPAVRAALAEHRTYHAVVRLPLGRMAMDVRFGRAGDYDIAVTMTGSQAMEMIFVDGRVYVKTPTDEKYTQLTDEAVDQILGQVGDLTPTSLAAELDKGMESMHYAGSMTTHGRKLYGYVIDLDPAYLAAQADVTPSQAAATEMSYRLWLDEDGLWWRSSVEVMGQRFDVRMSRWDQPVHIDAPPPSEIDYFNA